MRLDLYPNQDRIKTCDIPNIFYGRERALGIRGPVAAPAAP